MSRRELSGWFTIAIRNAYAIARSVLPRMGVGMVSTSKRNTIRTTLAYSYMYPLQMRVQQQTE